MYGFYTPIVLLQAFCIYHAYRNHSDYRWYWLILLFPGGGCAIYLIHHFYNRDNVKVITETVKGAVNSNYKTEQLEKAVQFSDSHTNRINLADAYLQIGRYPEAVELYRKSLSGFMQDDPTLKMKLLDAHFYAENFTDAIALGEQLRHEKIFANSAPRVTYAWALHFVGDNASAEKIFADLDKSFTNYPYRLEYLKFLVATGKTEEMKIKASELLDEFEHLRGPERKLHRNVMNSVRDLLANVDRMKQPAK